MHIRLLSNGKKWGTIAYAVKHQESQRKKCCFKSIKSKKHKYDACKRVKALLNCPCKKALTDEVTSVECPQVKTQMVPMQTEGPLSVVLKKPPPCPSHFTLSHLLTGLASNTCTIRYMQPETQINSLPNGQLLWICQPNLSGSIVISENIVCLTLGGRKSKQKERRDNNL